MEATENTIKFWIRFFQITLIDPLSYLSLNRAQATMVFKK